jgi:two-component system alkaline phosphatase synthesis response regulator PhoP
MDIDRFQATSSGRKMRLTRVEFDILEYLIRHSHRVVSHEELVRECIHGIFRAESSLVRVHVAHLRERLMADAWVIATVRGRGFEFLAHRQAGLSIGHPQVADR